MWCATLTFRLFRKRASKRTAPQRAEKTKQVTSSAAIGRVSPSLTEEGLSGRNAAEHAAARSTKLTSPSPSENRAPHAPAIEFDFTYGDRPRGSFPEVAWRKLTGDALFSVDSKANAYGDGLGEMELRAEIARRIHATRGVNCDPEQIVLQAGTQAALGNLLDLFDPMRDGVAIENPGYDGAMAVFRNRGFRITPLPVCPDTTEAQQDAFASSLYASGAKLTFCTPSNQFPLGMTMPLSMRVRLIKWAAERDGYILEDDYCREFRYTEPTHTKSAIARHTKSCDIYGHILKGTLTSAAHELSRAATATARSLAREIRSSLLPRPLAFPKGTLPIHERRILG